MRKLPLRERRSFACVAMLCPVIAGVMSPAARGEEVVLTNAAQVRALSQEEAAQRLPVKLRGIVIVEAENNGSGFVVLDDTEGIYVTGSGEQVQRVHRRDFIEIEGVSDPGGFAPFVRMRNFRKRGAREIPPPQPVMFEQLIDSRFDAQWVEVAGIVRGCEPVAAESERTAIELATGGQILAVRINKLIPSDSFVDAEVRMRGICFNQHNASRQFIRPLLHIPRDEPILVDKPAPADPFSMPITSIASLMRFAPDGSYGHRVRVRGVVTHHRPGEQLWIRGRGRGLRVHSNMTNALEPGDVVDVLGFPNRGAYTPLLEDAVFRVEAANPPPSPSVLTVLSNAPTRDADLIEIDARLVELKAAIQGSFQTVDLSLDWNGERVNALWRPGNDENVPDDWQVGSLVRAIGICVVTPETPAPPTGILQPRFFHVLLRSPRDVVVLQAPPWWTAERITWAASGVAAVLLITVGCVILAARWRLREHEARRATAEAEFSAILSERNRMAREIHDTLAQGLGAISMQLELAKDKVPAQANGLGTHLETAHQLVRSSMAEARRSIWNMRSQVLETGDLATALEGILTQLASGTSINARIKVNGSGRRLPTVTENNILRIGQEAITNAFKHSGASRIDVNLGFLENSIRLSVTDDGCGFDSDSAQIKDGRFGLTAMRERAALLHGKFYLTTVPGGGTTITLEVPTPVEGKTN